ncbi:MAG: Trk system potassium uptake protein TrkA, partial [uncultured Solirubrobacteraceae bacterium]
DGPRRRGRPRRIGRCQVLARRGPHRVGARRGPALARAPRRRPADLVGGRRRALHRRYRDRDRRPAGRGRRGGRHLHRRHARRQHEHPRRADRPEALRRAARDRARARPGALGLVQRAGPAHDLRREARHRDVRAGRHRGGGGRGRGL